MDEVEFMALCLQITKDGPIAGWQTDVLHDPDLWSRHLAIKAGDSFDEWNVYRYDPRNGVEHLGMFHGKTPLEIYKAVPRKVLA
jgi:hypothetical protein